MESGIFHRRALKPTRRAGPAFADGPSVALLDGSDGVLWAGTTRGLARVLPGGALTRFAVEGLPERTVAVIVRSLAGGLLVGVTEEGLFEVDPDAGGGGVGSTLVRGALDDVRANGRRVVPRCSFVRGYIERHPDYADLVDLA